jgi:hypothetical protein
LQGTLFIDRDPDLFNYIIEHLRTGKTSHIPFTDAAKSRQIREEAKYFNIPTLIEFFDPLRYPIETIGEENIKMKHNEDALRRLFAKDRSNPLLDDPYLHLLPVFEVRESFNQGDAPPSVPLMFNFEATANLGNQKNVPHPPAPRLTSTKQEFIDQFDAFTTGLFDGVDWSNVFAAGGGVLASAMKVENSAQKRTHNANFGTTDEEADGEITGLNVTKVSLLLVINSTSYMEKMMILRISKKLITWKKKKRKKKHLMKMYSQTLMMSLENNQCLLCMDNLLTSHLPSKRSQVIHTGAISKL